MKFGQFSDEQSFDSPEEIMVQLDLSSSNETSWNYHRNECAKAWIDSLSKTEIRNDRRNEFLFPERNI